MSTYPAGWYPDHAEAGQQRYWDGELWTHYVFRDDQATDGRKKPKPPKFKPSAQLVAATYRMLFADTSMVALLFVGALVAAAAGSAIMFPAVYWGDVNPSWSGGGVLGVVVAGTSLGAASFVFQVVCGAVVAAAILRSEGRPATARDALRVAWSRRRQLLAWALVSTVVGVVVRTLERMGIGGLVAALTLNLGWAFATVFATPVIMVEGTMPAATIRRSAGLLRGQFTVLLISSVTLALPWIALGIGSAVFALFGGVTLTFAGSTTATVTGALILATGVIGLCLVGTVSAALGAFLEAYLYRYATGRPVPGVDQHLLPPLRPT